MRGIMIMKTVVAGLFAISALAACSSTAAGSAPPVESSDDALVSAGRNVAVMRCSRCHALDSLSHSPLPAAPPMAEMLKRYDADVLASDLIDGIRVGHDGMPEFNLQVAEADALVAYLRSLR